jgi:hypothetical protein
MPEKYSTAVASVASGTDKTLINVFHSAATPTCRGEIAELIVGSADSPADQAANFILNRTTGVGTEGSGLTPVNLDPGGPAGEMDSGLGVFSVEPTYTSSKTLLQFALNQRGTFRWCAAPGYEAKMAATQNNGAGLKTTSSSSTQNYGAMIYFAE